MKNLFILFVFLFIFSLANAQTTEFGVTEAPQTMSQGVNNSLVVTLYNIKENVAESVFKDYMKQYKGRSKREKKTKALFIDNAKIRDLSNNTVDVYASFIEDKKADVTTVSVWFDLGGAYVSSALNGAQYAVAVNVLEGYKLAINNYLATEDLEFQEKTLKVMEKDMDKLVKDNETYQQKIKDAEELIIEMKKKIEENLKAQEAKSIEIDTQTKTVERARTEVKKNK